MWFYRRRVNSTNYRHTGKFRISVWVIALFLSFVEVIAQDFPSNNDENSNTYSEESQKEALLRFQKAESARFAQMAAQMPPIPGAVKRPANDYVAMAFGLDPNDPIFKDVAAKEFDLKKYQEASALIPYRPLIRHIKGDKGTAFPDAAKKAELEKVFEEKNKKIMDSINLDYEKLAEQSKQQALKQAEEALTPIHVPTCENSHREKIDMADIAPQILPFDRPPKNAPLLLDVLFLRIPPPPDADEFFGTKVQIYQITEDRGDAISATYSRFGLECLPYRARIYAGYTEALYGKDALLNFDKNKRGTIHPLVEKRLNDFIK